MKVFLGGTVNQSKWRDYVIPRLTVNYYNPVVEEWTEQHRIQEIYERQHCDFCLYVLTPRMTGFYALAEVVDDSYKRPDRTVFCILDKDDEFIFTQEQIKSLEYLRKICEHNGAKYLSSLDEVISFLNSSNKLDQSIINDSVKNVFISYGRKHSLAFARLLNKRLTDKGMNVWFDMNNIPLSVDFQEQIDQGIQKADNFIFIISPHSVKSEYCLKEIVLALKYNKRIIPILNVVPEDCWDKLHPEIARRNWLYMRQSEENAFELSQKSLFKKDKILETPIDQWGFTDDLEASLDDLFRTIQLQKEYVRNHTVLLNMALEWNENQRRTEYLLVGPERKQAEQWLLTKDFFNEKRESIQAPCLPTLLHAEFICESKKNANNMLCDTFLGHHEDGNLIYEKIGDSLLHHAISTWQHSTDIMKGQESEPAIKRGIEGADNYIFFISHKSLKSEQCLKELQIARSLNKRVIPILIEKINFENLNFNEPHYSAIDYLRKLQSIDFSDTLKDLETTEIILPANLTMKEKAEKDVNRRHEKTLFEKKIDELLLVIQTDLVYYQQHKLILVQALKWHNQNKNQCILLRGHNLDNAKTWIRLGEQKAHKPIALHKEFIEESIAKQGQLGTEVFISYSRTDGDFARRLNEQLQSSGKTTWFDQESIAKGVDFNEEIRKGIRHASNFLFIISPDSVHSKYCEEEVAYAKRLGRKIITVLCRKTDPDKLPEILKTINWIDFLNKDFNLVFPEVIRSLDTDREYVNFHARLSVRASEWESKNREKELLLKGSEFILAKEWLNQAYSVKDNKLQHNYAKLKSKKNPQPTDLIIRYISESDTLISRTEKLKKLMRLWLIISLIGSVVALVYSLYAMSQAEKQRDIIKEERDNVKKMSDSLARLNGSLLMQNEQLQELKDSINRLIKNYSHAETNLQVEQLAQQIENVTKQIEDKWDTCGTCKGAGTVICPKCKGTHYYWEGEMTKIQVKCIECNENGKVPCLICQGGGKINIRNKKAVLSRAINPKYNTQIKSLKKKN